MQPLAIGIGSGILIILILLILRINDKKIFYSMILSCIGFLYVGFVWSDMGSFIVSAIQAIIFLFIAYFGFVRSLYIIAAGYFLHACWDLTYSWFQDPGLIPPHYDLFCSSLDLVICFYLIIFKKSLEKKLSHA